MSIGLIIFVFGYVTFYWGYGHFGHQCRYSFWCLLGMKNLLPAQDPFSFAQGTASQSWTTLPGCTGNVGVPIPKTNGMGPATAQNPCGTYQGKPIQPSPPVRT